MASFSRMFADNENVVRHPRQHLRAQIAQSAVAKDAMRSVLPIGDLHRDLERRGDRLGENRDVVGQRVRNGVKVPLRNGDEVGEGAVVIQDAEHCSIRAMRRQTHAARLARPAGAVDFADNAAAGQRTRLCDTDELVTEHAAESHVALDQLEVGLAHAGAQSRGPAPRRRLAWVSAVPETTST